MLIKNQGQGNFASGRDADKRFFFKDREILLQEEMLIKAFFLYFYLQWSICSSENQTF